MKNIKKTVRFFVGNIAMAATEYTNFYGNQGVAGNKKDQLTTILKTRAKVLLFQEQHSKNTSPYIEGGYPELAEGHLRYLSHEKYRCRQMVSIHSKLPMVNKWSFELGKFHGRGGEIVPELCTLGRQARSVLAASVIDLGNGKKIIAATMHGAWIKRAHLGKPWKHQKECLIKLAEALEVLHATGLPIVLSADFNMRIRDVLPYLPKWLVLETPIEGTSLDMDPSHVFYKTAVASHLYVDAILTFGCKVSNLKEIRGISDHVCFTFDVTV